VACGDAVTTIEVVGRSIERQLSRLQSWATSRLGLVKWKPRLR
jgi:hypothetical protein